MLNDKTVCVDGMNLALQRGTGVATYARTLVYTLRKQGCNTGLLYGQTVKGDGAAERAASFCESLVSGAGRRRLRFYEKGWWQEKTGHVLGHNAERIDLDFVKNGLVPSSQSLFNVEALFRVADVFFRSTGRFLKIRFPSSVDIMHWTYPVPIRAVGAKNIYTLHDLVPLLHPEMTLDNTDRYRKMLGKIVQHADALCTVSETSKKDIERLFPRSRGKLFNTYQAHSVRDDIASLDATSLAELVTQYTGLRPGDYFIHYGQIEPKKNTMRILEAFLASKAGRKLVMVGSTGWKNEEILALLHKGQEMGRVVHIPYLPGKALFSLLRGARALFFPSLVEGFGLPVLEAFSLGTPVLTSNDGALKEVAGEAALLVDPLDVGQMRQAMEALDRDDELCARLSAAGEERQEFFSLSAYQARLRAFYDASLGLL